MTSFADQGWMSILQRDAMGRITFMSDGQKYYSFIYTDGVLTDVIIKNLAFQNMDTSPRDMVLTAAEAYPAWMAMMAALDVREGEGGWESVSNYDVDLDKAITWTDVVFHEYTFFRDAEPPEQQKFRDLTTLDASRDKIVSPLDALVIINDINANHPHGFVYSFDVNRDGIVTAADVLLVINYLNYRADMFPEGESVTNIAGPMPVAEGVEVFTIQYASGLQEQVDAKSFKLTVAAELAPELQRPHGRKATPANGPVGVPGVSAVRDSLDIVAVHQPVNSGAFDLALTDLLLPENDLTELARAELRDHFAAVYGTSFDAMEKTSQTANYIFAERIQTWPQFMKLLLDAYCPDESAVLLADQKSRQALKEAALKAVEPGYEWLVDWDPSSAPVDLYYTIHKPDVRAEDFRSVAVLDPKDRLSLLVQGQSPERTKEFESELGALVAKSGVSGFGKQVRVIPVGQTSREVVRQVQAFLGRPATEAMIQRAFADSRDEILDRVGLRGAHLLKSPEQLKDIVAIHIEVALLKQQDFRSLQKIDVETWMTEHGYTLEALVRNVMLAVAAVEKIAQAA
jgi:hypothetical protein